jgi:hypothetical protein
MKLLEVLRKGFSFLLMSMGVSSPESKKPRPKAGPGSSP